MLDRAAMEIAQALRRLGRRKAESAAAVALLGLALAATLVFGSALDQVVLRDLPVPHPEELVLVRKVAVAPSGAVQTWPRFSEDECRELRQETVSAVRLACFGKGEALVQRGTEPAREPVAWVTASYFDVLGLRAAEGRLFVDDDDPRRGADAVAVLAYDAWVSRFGRADVVGTKLLVDGAPTVVVGVAPRGFSGIEVGYAPMLFLQSARAPRGPALLEGLGRLVRGGDLRRAESMLRSSFLRLEAARLQTPQPMRRQEMLVDGRIVPRTDRIDLEPGRRGESLLRGPFARTIASACALAAALWLLVAANLANLLALRSAWGRRDRAVRSALGASAGRLAVPWLLDGALLGSASALLAVPLAIALGPALLGGVPELAAGAALVLRSDSAMLAMALLAALVTAAAIGGGAALDARRQDISRILHGAGSADARGSLWRSLCLALQVACSIALLAVMGLLGRTVQALSSVSTGLPVERTIALPIALPAEDRRPRDTLERCRAAVAALPGVGAAGYASPGLLTGDGESLALKVEGYEAAGDAPAAVDHHSVSLGFLETMALPLVAGRSFASADLRALPGAAVVDERFVRRYLGDAAPLGHRLSTDPAHTDWARAAPGDLRIVGVVADGRLSDVRETERPHLYTLADVRENATTLYARSELEPAGLAAALRSTVRAAAPSALLGTPRTLRALEHKLLDRELLLRDIAAASALVGLAVTMLGLYGVIGLEAHRRRRDIAVRLALGARAADVVVSLARRIAAPLGLGLAVGVGLALAGGAILRSLLWGIAPGDPPSLILAAVATGVAALLACWRPLARALATAPARVLADSASGD